MFFKGVGEGSWELGGVGELVSNLELGGLVSNLEL